MSDIFISYAREDLLFARNLAAALAGCGWTVWWDRNIPPGRSFDEVIEEEIESTRCILVLWSKHSVDSRWVRTEAAEGAERNILLPVMIEEVRIPLAFRRIHAASLEGWDGSESAPAFERLAHNIAEIINSRTSDTGSRVGPPPEQGDRHGERQEPAESLGASRKKARYRLSAPKLLGALLLIALLPAVWFAVHLETPDDSVQISGKQPDSAGSGQTAADPAGKPDDGSAFSPAGTEAVAQPPPVQVTSPAAPPPDYFVLDSVGDKPNTHLRLREISQRPNKVTDIDEWWVGNRLSPLTYAVPNPFMQIAGDLPEVVPRKFRGEIVVKVIRGDPLLAIYGENFSEGRYLLAINPADGRIESAWDFQAYRWPASFDRAETKYVSMSTRWAYLEAGTLYVTHSHNTYADSSHGFNAYISALDVRTGMLLWRSRPLVCNTENFLVKGDAIITGYGFTREDDYLYVLNKENGHVVQQVGLKTGPEYLVEKDDKLYVRTYNTDYVFAYE